MDDPRRTLELLDYRRQVADLYHDVRADGSERPGTWQTWVARRDQLFAGHPQSALPAARRAGFTGLPYFAHDPAMRTVAEVEPADGQPVTVGHSAAGGTLARRVGIATFRLGGTALRLALFWLEQYGGGLFVPFRDATNGRQTYGGGRYLLDTAKGADLGADGAGRLVLDFNYAYHPSCVHDPIWSCPLSPPENHLVIPIEAGERGAGAPGGG